jgi:hypothetical protein
LFSSKTPLLFLVFFLRRRPLTIARFYV